MSVSGGGVEIPTVFVQWRNLLVRIFNGAGDTEERTISLEVRPLRVELAKLEGRSISQLEVR